MVEREGEGERGQGEEEEEEERWDKQTRQGRARLVLILDWFSR